MISSSHKLTIYGLFALVICVFGNTNVARAAQNYGPYYGAVPAFDHCNVTVSTSAAGTLSSQGEATESMGVVTAEGKMVIDGSSYTWIVQKFEEGAVSFTMKRADNLVALISAQVSDTQLRKDAQLTLMTMASGTPFQLVRVNCK